MHPRRTAHLLSRVVLMVLLSAPFLVVSAQDAKPATDKDAKAVEETPAEPQPEMEPSVPEMEEEVIGSVSPAERMKQGGKTMLFLLALSVIALTFSLERAVRLRRGAVAPDGLVDEARDLWDERNYDEILALCERRPSTLATIIDAFVRHRHCTSQELSMLAGDLAGRDMRRHLQRAYPIAVVATLSPLLGLLGTVVGMIESFEIVAIAGSLGDASLMAGSISKALVTTAGGLVIAIPALGLYHLFKSRTQGLTMQLEGEVHELLTAWFMEARRDREADHAG
jgi:biopolymer transport protein ExbB